MRVMRAFRNIRTPALKQSELSEEHTRNIEPYRPLLVPEDFRGKSVLDLGCGDGVLSFLCLIWKAADVCGVETDKEIFKKAIENAKAYSTDMKSLFICDDPNRFSFWNTIGTFDAVLSLPLFPSDDAAARRSLLSRAAAHTKKTMYISGSPDETAGSLLSDILAFTDFPSIEYKGELTSGEKQHSPLFRLSRTILTQKRTARMICSWIKNGTYSKIAVAGKAASGKSLIRKKLKSMIDFDHEYEIIDDCNDKDHLNSAAKMVLFDYRALEYVDDFDAVIFVHTDERMRRNDMFLSRTGRFILTKWLGYRILPEKHYLKPSPGGSFKNIKAVYTVKR